MTYLLDVNVLVALLDQDHIFHDVAHRWFEKEGAASWATCPITENGLVRILGHVRYPKGPGTPAEAAELFGGIRRLEGHVFWSDEISLFGPGPVRLEAIGSSAQISDAYLLGLAVYRGGKLATFDRRLAPAVVTGGAEALTLIS